MSDQASAFVSGRIIYGLQPPGMGQFNRPETTLWNDETEAQYMDQVRERAQQMASEILAQALAEAEQIRQQAKIQGFEQGRSEFQNLAQKEQKKAASFLASLHDGLRIEKIRITTAHRETLFRILTLLFEKSLGIILDAKRLDVLAALFDESVEQIQTSATLTLFVGPQDAELAKQVLDAAKNERPELPEITLRISPELSGGGVRMESGDGLVDNALESRLVQVREILAAYSENV